VTFVVDSNSTVFLYDSSLRPQYKRSASWMHRFPSLPTQELLEPQRHFNPQFTTAFRNSPLNTSINLTMCWWTWVSGRACAYMTDPNNPNGPEIPRKKGEFMVHGAGISGSASPRPKVTRIAKPKDCESRRTRKFWTRETDCSG
jgi:hypothetical protein